jgi:hypothetical protein
MQGWTKVWAKRQQKTTSEKQDRSDHTIEETQTIIPPY